ncbi:hypothetical protein [Marivita sp.]|uniref:hypothetical protein n=1 Tax=Marivita sp. TaxID=2003365 RepID=UPI00261D2754|nr:hypothetical protein [Marivita sp.]
MVLGFRNHRGGGSAQKQHLGCMLVGRVENFCRQDELHGFGASGADAKPSSIAEILEKDVVLLPTHCAYSVFLNAD